MKKDILDLKFESADLRRKVTIRYFFYEILKKLWAEQQNFNSKRLFGNSDWDGDLIVCLIKNEIIKGEVDEDGYIVHYDEEELNNVVINSIIKPIFNIK